VNVYPFRHLMVQHTYETEGYRIREVFMAIFYEDMTDIRTAAKSLE